jgi:nucleoside triphosphatase
MNEISRVPEAVVGALLVDPQGRLFLARFTKRQGRYVIPGGHIDYGETAAQALVRETQEEANLTPTAFRLFAVHERIFPPHYKDGRHHLVYLDFLVEAWEGTLQLDGDELYDGQWVSPQEALDLQLTDTTRRLIEYYVAVGRDGPVRYLPDDLVAR